MNKLIQEEKHNLSPIATQLLYLLVNYDECVSTKPCQEFTNVIKKVMTSKLKHGGDPQGIITTLFIPLLHQSFPEHTIQILKEINLPFKHFNNNLDKTDFDYTVDKSFNDSLYDTYQEILKFNDEFGLRKFKIATLSIFFSDIYSRASTNSGHAVTLVQDEKNDFYIIDDAHVVLPVKTYLSYIKNSIYEMEIRDMDDETIKHFIEVLGPNYRVDRRIYRIKIKPAFMSGVKPTMSMRGGNGKSFGYGKNNFTTNKNEMSETQQGGLTISFGNHSHHPPGPPHGPHHKPHHPVARIHKQTSKTETIMVCIVMCLMFIVIIVSVIAGIVQGKKTTPASSAPGTGTTPANTTPTNPPK